jgi:hypothetical protein
MGILTTKNVNKHMGGGGMQAVYLQVLSLSCDGQPEMGLTCDRYQFGPVYSD